ncbi:hypothetical protein HORIV_56100 [Vreelandella olivaria]|uniref:Uncharacterized protein n=1 Tax=Vreelandella olivaria TaxID=390919 RepID=A0ABM7GR38_9GAMM|nr:hypothetical protein HORIV_56100 [Halomonas olivaria]
MYAGNSIGQLDDQGWGGLLKSLVSGQRATSKQMPLGYGQMPADFLNAYVLGSVGGTGAALVPAPAFCITCAWALMTFAPDAGEW